MATLSGLPRAAAAAAVALAAFAAGSGLGAAPAYADDGREGSSTGVPKVSFVGGSLLNLIVCRSQPSRSALTVPAESRVMFVNRLGQDAVLRVDGRPVVHVGPGQAVPLVVRHGPVSVSMTFSCGAPVVEQFLATTVSVAARTRPRPTGATPSPTAGTGPSRPAGATRSRPAATGEGKGAPAKAGPGNLGHAELSPAQPAGPAAPTAGSRSATANATPSAVDRSPVPAAAPVADTPSASPPINDAVAVEPLVRAADSSRDTSSTLLASIVAIFVVGVTITAIRVIILKRTNRTHYA